MQKRMFRGLLIAYPFVAGALYFFLAWGPSQRMARLEAEMQQLKESKDVAHQELKLKHKRQRQVQAIEEVMAEFRTRTGNVSVSSAPGYIARKASENDLQPGQISLMHKTEENGWLFCDYRVEVRGPYQNLVAFLHSLEQDEITFVRIKQTSLTKTETQDEAALVTVVDVLLELPPETDPEEPRQTQTHQDGQ